MVEQHTGLMTLMDDDPITNLLNNMTRVCMKSVAPSIERVFVAFMQQGIMHMVQLRSTPRHEVISILENAEPPIARSWIDTVEMSGKFKFWLEAPVHAPSSAAISSGSLSEAQKGPRLTFRSSEEKVVCLGDFLDRAGRLDEVSAVFSQAHLFKDVFATNPQIFQGKPLKHSAKTAITNIVLDVTFAKWARLDTDKTFRKLVVYEYASAPTHDASHE